MSSEINRTSRIPPSNLAGRKRKERLFYALCLLATCLGVLLLGVLLYGILRDGARRLSLDFLQSFPSRFPDRAGIKAALYGSVYLMGLTAAFTFPIGVGAAIYLEEFARRNRLTSFIEANIANLAGVPSVVYGILGLGFLVRGPGGLGPTVLAAALTLSLLVFPIVVIASREAIRAVPNSIRLGALALGATPWQAVRTQVLPAAVPGIATGSILALSRAIGEAAPLLLVGGLTFITFNPSGLDSAFTVLPIQIFNWISRPQAEFKVLAAAAIVVLVAILLAMNSVAIWLRNRYQRKW